MRRTVSFCWFFRQSSAAARLSSAFGPLPLVLALEPQPAASRAHAAAKRASVVRIPGSVGGARRASAAERAGMEEARPDRGEHRLALPRLLDQALVVPGRGAPRGRRAA